VARPHEPVCAPYPLSQSLLCPAQLTLLPRSYISYRQSYAHHPTQRNRYGPSSASDRFGGSGASTGVLFSADEDRRGLLSSGAYDVDDGDAVIEMDLLPPRWADASDEVTELLADIASKSQKLERLHQKHVLPGFNDEETKKAEEGEIERLTQDITRGFHECGKCIRRIEQMVREGKANGQMSRADEIMAKNIKVNLATRVQEASAGFRKKQSAYLKSRLTRQSPRTAGMLTFFQSSGESLD
jgi:syntaxin 16